MLVDLKFDTEKDSLADFRKLRDYVDNIIAEKEGRNASSSEVKTSTETRTEKPAQAPARTSGGCRVVPYQDLSNQLFSLCSKRR